jgi:hypothetical protein
MRWMLIVLLLACQSAHAQNVYGKSPTLKRITRERMPESIEQNCVLWMPFDYGDESTNTLYSFATTGADAVMMTNGYFPTWATNGVLFDGADDVVYGVSNAAMNNLWATGGTVTAWIYPLSMGEKGLQAGYVATKYKDATNVWILNLTGQLNFPTNVCRVSFAQSSSGGLGTWLTEATSYRLIFKAWNHVAVTYSKSSVTNLPITYINGEAQTLTTVTQTSGTMVDDSAGPFILGNRAALDRAFDGQLDDLRLFNRILTAAEIMTIYTNTAWRYQSLIKEAAIRNVTYNGNDGLCSDGTNIYAVFDSTITKMAADGTIISNNAVLAQNHAGITNHNWGDIEWFDGSLYSTINSGVVNKVLQSDPVTLYATNTIAVTGLVEGAQSISRMGDYWFIGDTGYATGYMRYVWCYDSNFVQVGKCSGSDLPWTNGYYGYQGSVAQGTNLYVTDHLGYLNTFQWGGTTNLTRVGRERFGWIAEGVTIMSNQFYRFMGLSTTTGEIQRCVAPKEW